MSADLEVQVFLADPARQHARDLERAWATLDADEQARADRLQDARDRQTYVVAHALLRCVLARRIGGGRGGGDGGAASLRFRRAPHGRPELAAGLDPAAEPAPTPAAATRFNLAHTRGLVGCAVTTVDVGFDLEETRLPTPLEVAPRFFSPEELARLRRLPPARQPQRFYALWTLKESYIKGRGLGLAIPLDSFSVDPEPRGRARLVAEAPEDGGAWTLRHWKLQHHAMALAVRAASARLRISLSIDQRIGTLLDSADQD